MHGAQTVLKTVAIGEEPVRVRLLYFPPLNLFTKMTKSTFVVAHLSLHVGEIVQEVITADDAFQAMKIFLDPFREGGYDHCKTEEDIYQIVADQDGYISVIQI